MSTQNLLDLKLHKVTNETYNNLVESENLDGTALYLTPEVPITVKTNRGSLEVDGEEINLVGGDSVTVKADNNTKTITVSVASGDTDNEGIVKLSSDPGDYTTVAATPLGVQKAFATNYITAGQLEGSPLGDKATAEGDNVYAAGNASHAEGTNTATIGTNAHAEGNSSGSIKERCAHVTSSSDFDTLSSAFASQGAFSVAFGNASHIEGLDNIAYGDYSHAEGTNTTAKGTASHAGGIGTIASAEAQTVIGKYNQEDTEDKALFIVGNGTGNSDKQRSNAFVVYKDGSIGINLKGTFYKLQGGAEGDVSLSEDTITIIF